MRKKILATLMVALALVGSAAFARILPFVGNFGATASPNTGDVLMLEDASEGKWKITVADLIATVFADLVATNGLTESPEGTIKLGGTLTETTSVDMASYDLSMSTTTTGPTLEMLVGPVGTQAGYTIEYNSALLGVYDLGNGQYGGLNITPTVTQLIHNVGGQSNYIEANASGLLLRDAGLFGAKYQFDYSALGVLDPLWIPHWSAVTGAIDAVTLNGGSAITIDGTNNIDLGGALDATASIDGGFTHGLEFIDGNFVYLEAYTDSGYGTGGRLDINNNYFDIERQENGGTMKINFDAPRMLVQDTIQNVGLTYHADYSAAGMLNPLWIPHWSAVTGYVQTELASYVPLSVTGNWNTAFGRGDHSLVGYLTAETDPLWTAASGDYYTTGTSDSLFVHLTGDETIYGIKYFTGAIDVNGYASYTNTGDMGSSPEDFAHKEYVDNGDVLGDGTFYFSGSYMYVGPRATTGTRQIGLSGTDYCKRQYTGGAFVESSCEYLF